jgi:hypothetical protein
MTGTEQRALQRKLDVLHIRGARLMKLALRSGRGFAWFITPNVGLTEDQARTIIARPDVVVANRDSNGIPNAWMVGA